MHYKYHRVYPSSVSLSEAVYSEVNLIIHVSYYSFSPVMERTIIQLVYREGRSRGSEPHLAQGWEIFCLHSYGQGCASRSAAVTAISEKDRNAQQWGGKVSEHSDNEGIKAHSSHGEVLVLAAVWGMLHTHSLWT